MGFRVLALGFAAVLSASVSHAAWYETRITNSVAPSTAPLVAYDGFDVLHVFWLESGTSWHMSLDGGMWTGPDWVGSGEILDHYICPACNEVHLVWVDTPTQSLRYRLWKNGVWIDEELPPSGSVGPVVAASVTKRPAPHVIWAERNETTDETWIFYSSSVLGDWSEPTPLAGPLVASSDDPPVLNIAVMNSEGWLIAGWLQEGLGSATGLSTRVWNLTEWLPEEASHEMWGTGFELDRHRNGGNVGAASHSVQPTCPCNDVFYAEFDGTSWSATEAIGTGHTGGEWEWPRELDLNVSAEYEPHLVWRHETYDESLDLTDTRLVYATRSGAWAFDPLAVGRDPRSPSIGTTFSGEPAIGWCDDSAGNMEVYLATTVPIVGVGQSVTPPSDRVSLAPNPFATEVVISAEAREVRAITVFDVAGRPVRRLFPEAGGAGWRASWDGADDRGRVAPPGVYFLRVVMDEATVTRSVVRAEP